MPEVERRPLRTRGASPERGAAAGERPVILVCGEALVDLFVEGASAAPGAGLAARAVPGGSPFNLAVGLARLGAPSAYLGGLSRDGFGRLLAGRLAAEGVDTRFAKASARPTPLAVVGQDPEGRPDYTFHVEGCAHADLTPADLPQRLGDAVTALALGSFALAVEPVGSTLVALAERESARRVVSVDPNLRPALVGDPERWRARFEGLVRHAAIIKLSDEDLSNAYGPEADPDAHAAAWLAGGAALVVLTRSALGATAWHAGGRVAVPGRPVAVVDTVGAGDTVHAAILAHLARAGRLTRHGLAALDSRDLHALLSEAVAAASLTCARRGADLPTRAELQAALA